MRTASRLPRADGADDSLNIEKLRRDVSVAEFMEIASVLEARASRAHAQDPALSVKGRKLQISVSLLDAAIAASQ
jgi:hypothetical protein